MKSLWEKRVKELRLLEDVCGERFTSIAGDAVEERIMLRKNGAQLAVMECLQKSEDIHGKLRL